MTNGREISPPPGFLAVPTITTMFAATIPKNTPLAYRASTSTNPNPVISPAFMEANYETLESLLRARQRTRSSVEHLSIDLSLTYKGLMEKTYTWVEAREVATNGVSSDQRDSFERPKKYSWDNNSGQKNKYMFSPYQGPNHSLLSNLSKSLREILAIKRATKSFEPPLKMCGRKRLRDNSKYCHFRKDYRHDTNDCSHLKVQIQEAISLGQLSHLVKGIKKEKAKSTDTPRGEGKKDKSITPVKAPILMINKKYYAIKNTISKSMAYKEGIMFPPVTRVSNTSVIIEVAVFRRKVRRVYMDSGSTCEGSHYQIQMAEKDEDKTAFFIGEVSFAMGKCHLSFKKQGQRIQRLVDKVFSKQIERNLKAYVDDMVIKRTSEEGMLTPMAGKTLIMYLATLRESINAALFAKRSEGQIPIYFVSRVLQGPKLNYPTLENLILALVHAARRLRRYLQAHTIMVLIGTPIKQALTGPKKTGRVAKWAIEFGKHDIVFLKRDERETPADFLLEIPFDDSEKRVKEKEVSYLSNEWKLYTNGASSSDGAGSGLMLIDPTGKEYTYSLSFEFETTNYEAKYEALLARLRIAHEMEITKVAIFLDLQLVVNQIKGTYAVKQLSIKSYLQKVKTALRDSKGIQLSMEAAKAIQDCDKCKEQSAIRKAGMDGAITVESTWPFSHWGIHILGPLPMAPGGCVLSWTAFCPRLRFVKALRFAYLKTIYCVLLRTDSAKIKTALHFVSGYVLPQKTAFCYKRSCIFLKKNLTFCLKNIAPNGEALRKCILSGPYKPTTVLVHAVEATDNSPAVPEYTTLETPSNMSPENKAHFLTEKEAIHLILTGIGDDIYSTVDAGQIAQEMWEAIERLQQGKSQNIQDVKTNLFWEFEKFTSHDGESMESYYTRFYKLMNKMIRNNLTVTTMQVNIQFLQQLQPGWSRFVMIVKQQHKLDEVPYHKLFDILKQYQNEVNELRAEKLAKNANPLALVATVQASQYPFYQSSRSHRSSAPSPKPSIPSRSHTSTRHKGKEIAKPITPSSKTASEEDSDPEQAQRDKDIQKNLALITKYFKKIYKPTNNNLRTSSNSKNKNVDTTSRYKNDEHSGQFGTQRIANVAGTRDKVGSPVVQKSGIQCFNCKEYGHFAKECRKPKRVKDSAYHKEKMLLCKQAEQGVPLQAEQYDWLADTDEEVDEQELKYITATWLRSSRFLQLTQAQIQSQWNSNTCLVETDGSNVIPDSPDMCEDDIQNEQNDVESVDERVALAKLIANLKLDVDENKKIQKKLKKANTTLAQELKECKAILTETSKSLGESIIVRDSCLVALQTKQAEFEKFKAFNDRTVDYEKLERKLNDALGQLAYKDTVIREGLKTKAYEL
nr:putative reverse transcriptase domain, ribonuclease H-like domain protein [Tanacetum cinerariifolium]GEX97607.1 putative reverse transcriptase domain, ribonuclease H-like domain protein [Tanacetum cinerariifolium]GEX98461.1 putative reverse transcriptase domain, ribonuclease H-like domain protein [Tanacetum cinerariifolium]